MKYIAQLTFTEPVLGTAPMNKQIYTDYILQASVKAHNNGYNDTGDEVATVPDGDKGVTGFHRLEDGTPMIYDYVLKGFAKDACAMMARQGGSLSKQIRAYKKVIDGLFFVFPRRIPICNYGQIGTLERPLRAMTAQGERVALAKSEMIQAGAVLNFTIEVLDDATVTSELIEEWFDYGRYRGLGQWRNGSYGRFEYEMRLKVK